MNQFNQPPQSPKYTQEKLTQYLKETDGALSTMTKVLVRGFEENSDVYKPWPKSEVKKSLASILALFESKVKYYEGAGKSEKTKKAQAKVQELRSIFATIDNSEEVPEDFLHTVQQAVENDLNLSENPQVTSN
jgi:hypothetical protein